MGGVCIQPRCEAALRHEFRDPTAVASSAARLVSPDRLGRQALEVMPRGAALAQASAS